MANILATIPKNRFKNWPLAERACRMCDGETNWGKEGTEWLWFVRVMHPPKKPLDNAVCFMTFGGLIRGYFNVIEVSEAQKWIDLGYIFDGKPTKYVVVLAHWHNLPPSKQVPCAGFQGWRYTQLQP